MIALVFPGQGSQYIGMGKNLNHTKYFDQANEVLGFDLKDLCFNGSIQELTLTKNTQPAILTHSISLLENLKTELPSLNFDYVLGHSVGEYAALVAAEVLTFKDALSSVRLRGEFMQKAVPESVGAMVALIKIPSSIIQKACDFVSKTESQVMIANFNEPNQTVISGHKEACQMAVDWLKENYDKPFRAIPLKVSAPFHSSLMKPAEHQLAKYFDNIHFNESTIKLITNIDSEINPVNTPGDVFLKKLTAQVSGSVLWVQSILKLPKNSMVLEVGPGKVLTGLISKIREDLKVINLDQENSIQQIKDIL